MNSLSVHAFVAFAVCIVCIPSGGVEAGGHGLQGWIMLQEHGDRENHVRIRNVAPNGSYCLVRMGLLTSPNCVSPAALKGEQGHVVELGADGMIEWHLVLDSRDGRSTGLPASRSKSIPPEVVSRSDPVIDLRLPTVPKALAGKHYRIILTLRYCRFPMEANAITPPWQEAKLIVAEYRKQP